MEGVWSVFDLARTATLFAVAVILVSAALTTTQSGDVTVLSDFIILAIAGMLMMTVLAWAWNWIETAGGR